jgi:hypothetical protein
MVVSVRSVLLLEVLLDVRGLVLDVETRLHAIGDHPCAIAVRGRGRPTGQPKGEEEADAIGAPEVEILADDRFEEVAALHGLVADVREAHFELTDREAVVITRGPVGRGHRPREPLRPAIEEGLHVGRAERIAGGLQRGGIAAAEKPVVETLKAHALATQVLLDPLVPVETELHRIRHVRSDLEEGWAPRTVEDVEVVVVDRDGLAREIEGDLRARP